MQHGEGLGCPCFAGIGWKGFRMFCSSKRTMKGSLMLHRSQECGRKGLEAVDAFERRVSGGHVAHLGEPKRLKLGLKGVYKNASRNNRHNRGPPQQTYY